MGEDFARRIRWDQFTLDWGDCKGRDGASRARSEDRSPAPPGPRGEDHPPGNRGYRTEWFSFVSTVGINGRGIATRLGIKPSLPTERRRCRRDLASLIICLPLGPLGQPRIGIRVTVFHAVYKIDHIC